MSSNQIKIRRKEGAKFKMKKINVLISLAAVFILCIAGALAAKHFSDKLGYSNAPLEIVSEAGKTIIRVPPGGDLQAAIERARSGDVVELAAGATYYGEIKLPNKPLADFVTIQSSAAGQLAENQRVSPSQSKLFAKIVSRGKGAAAVSVENAANHYRFVGIEFAPDNADYVYNLVFLGEPKNPSEAARDLEFDRCYFHPFQTGVTRRAIALNSRSTTIKNSYLAGFGYPQQEAQAICGWTGTKDAKIINNYLEGGAENILFGGSDPPSAEMIPADIEIRGNYLNKPAEWKGKASTKCLFELKNAKRVEFTGNYLTNNWDGAAFRITVRNQDGSAKFSTIEDVLIKDNVINGAGDGINILGKDDTYESQTLKRLNVVNNLFLNIGGDNFSGTGYFVQIAEGENILIADNTVFNLGNIASFHDAPPRDFLFRDNIVGHGSYGIHGFANLRSIAGQQIFQNNIIVNNRNVAQSDFSFPGGNFPVKDYNSVGFADYANGDFRLSAASRFHGKGKNGTDIGSNLSANSPAK